MTISFSTISLTQLIWIILILVALAAIFIVVRFFFHHILKYLVQGCLVVFVIVAILAILHFFRVF